MTKRVTVETLQKRWLTTKEAMVYLGVSEDFMRRMREEDKVPYYKPLNSKLCWYAVEDLDNFILKNRA